MNKTVSTTEFEPYMGEPDVARFIRAMKRQEVDRVPNFEALIEDTIVEKILGRFAGNTLSYGGEPAKGVQDPEITEPMKSKDYLELCKIIGQDVMIIDAVWVPFRKEDENGNLVMLADKSVKNISDFKKVEKPGQKDIDLIVKRLMEYREAVKGTKIGVTVLHGGLFTRNYEFTVGMNDFMIACYRDKLFIEGILEAHTEYLVKLVKAIIKEGIDIDFPYDDIGLDTGMFIPYKLMKEIWVPRMARIIKPAVEAKIPVIWHSDGKIDEVIEDLIEMGVDCINPMDPYSMDYRELKKKYGKRVAFSGNIDIEFPLYKGTPEDVENDVKAHMDVMKPGYGYVCGSSHSIVDYIPYENFVTMINAIHKYGKY
ncbi:MAG: hypothetical protein H8E13_08060 [Actinobacteria bacterium]|nr:hypothetical protein [Actinomycetota bacterium]